MDALPLQHQKMIAAWIKKNLDGCSDPKTVSDGKPLRGTKNGWRYRVGSYRIVASIVKDELIIKVVRVGHRQGVYANLPDL